MNKKLWRLWLILLAGLLTLFGFWEANAIFDDDINTIALTTYVTNFIPPLFSYVVLAIGIAVLVWLIPHFRKYYKLNYNRKVYKD